jgi:hypothetical protein
MVMTIRDQNPKQAVGRRFKPSTICPTNRRWLQSHLLTVWSLIDHAPTRCSLHELGHVEQYWQLEFQIEVTLLDQTTVSRPMNQHS